MWTVSVKNGKRGRGGAGLGSSATCALLTAVGTRLADLSQRAGHPPEQLKTLHGSLFDIKCSADACGWVQHDNYDDPFCAPRAPASEDSPPGEPLPLLDPYHRIRHIPEEELPRCPQCRVGLQRLGKTQQHADHVLESSVVAASAETRCDDGVFGSEGAAHGLVRDRIDDSLKDL